MLTGCVPASRPSRSSRSNFAATSPDISQARRGSTSLDDLVEESGSLRADPRSSEDFAISDDNSPPGSAFSFSRTRERTLRGSRAINPRAFGGRPSLRGGGDDGTGENGSEGRVSQIVDMYGDSPASGQNFPPSGERMEPGLSMLARGASQRGRVGRSLSPVQEIEYSLATGDNPFVGRGGEEGGEFSGSIDGGRSEGGGRDEYSDHGDHEDYGDRGDHEDSSDRSQDGEHSDHQGHDVAEQQLSVEMKGDRIRVPHSIAKAPALQPAQASMIASRRQEMRGGAQERGEAGEGDGEGGDDRYCVGPPDCSGQPRRCWQSAGNGEREYLVRSDFGSEVELHDEDGDGRPLAIRGTGERKSGVSHPSAAVPPLDFGSDTRLPSQSGEYGDEDGPFESGRRTDSNHGTAQEQFEQLRRDQGAPGSGRSVDTADDRASDGNVSDLCLDAAHTHSNLMSPFDPEHETRGLDDLNGYENKLSPAESRRSVQIAIKNGRGFASGRSFAESDRSAETANDHRSNRNKSHPQHFSAPFSKSIASARSSQNSAQSSGKSAQPTPLSSSSPATISRATSSRPETVLTHPSGPARLLHTLSQLWRTSSQTDLTIICGDYVLPVHRCIIAAQSPYFTKLVRQSTIHGTGESSTLYFDQADPDAVRAVLAYFYLGELKVPGYDELEVNGPSLPSLTMLGAVLKLVIDWQLPDLKIEAHRQYREALDQWPRGQGRLLAASLVATFDDGMEDLREAVLGVAVKLSAELVEDDRIYDLLAGEPLRALLVRLSRAHKRTSTNKDIGSPMLSQTAESQRSTPTSDSGTGPKGSSPLSVYQPGTKVPTPASVNSRVPLSPVQEGNNSARTKKPSARYADSRRRNGPFAGASASQRLSSPSQDRRRLSSPTVDSGGLYSYGRVSPVRSRASTAGISPRELANESADLQSSRFRRGASEYSRYSFE